MIRIGVVGYGEWGPNMARMFNQISGSILTAVCDLRQHNLSLAKKRHPDIMVFSDYNDMLKVIDAVVITSPPATHYRFAKQALDRGLPVMVEKPFVLDLKEAIEIVNLAHKKKLVLMIGHILEYHPAVLYLKEYISSGKAGEIYYLYAQRLNLGRIRREENVIWSFGPHDISTILYILDKHPIEVSVQSESYLQKGIVDVAFLTLRFPNDILAHIHLSWLDPSKVRKLTIVGSKNMLVFDDMEPAEKVRVYNKGTNTSRRYENYGELISLRNGDVHIPYIEPKEPLRSECEHFIECICAAKAPRSGGDNGIKVLRILKAAQESFENQGRTVRIKWQ